MTSPVPSRLLISHITLRGPELQQLHRQIAERPEIGFEELRRETGGALDSGGHSRLADAPLREALSFLVLAGLVEQMGSLRTKARYRVADGPRDLPFSLTLLYHLNRHPDLRQQAILLVHRQLVLDGQLAITPLQVRESMERGPHQHLFAWTGEKVLFWCHLSAHLGLLRRLDRSSEILAVPQLALVLAALRWAGGAEAQPIVEVLKMIEHSLFACFTRRGQVHAGLAQALVALDRLGCIKLAHQADAAQSVLLGDWRVSVVTVALEEFIR